MRWCSGCQAGRLLSFLQGQLCACCGARAEPVQSLGWHLEVAAAATLRSPAGWWQPPLCCRTLVAAAWTDGRGGPCEPSPCGAALCPGGDGSAVPWAALTGGCCRLRSFASEYQEPGWGWQGVSNEVTS